MLLSRVHVSLYKTLIKTRQLHITPKFLSEKRENPFWRTLRILREDFTRVKEYNPGEKFTKDLDNLFPSYVDIAIIGGGAIGSSIAYWLKEKSGVHGLNIVVIEKDLSYKESSTVLSVGGLRQQFSLPENIQMSLYGAEFLRTLKQRFGQEADVYFAPNGYLMLASEQGAQQMLDNRALQHELGAVNELLSKDELHKRFPWLNASDIEIGCLGLEKEGWFDPWSLLYLLRANATSLGTKYLQAEAVDFTFRVRQDVEVEGVEGAYEGVNELIVRMPNGDFKPIQFAIVVIAAGAQSGAVARLARIGTGKNMLSIPLPVEKRKRYVYRFDCQGEGPTINTPMTIDYTGTYFRRDGLGGSFIGGLSPLPEEEPSTENLDVDYQFFDEKVWPNLAKRVPCFDAIKVRSAWSGYYDYNMYDENGIIGPHPYYNNLYIATGFSGHGIQQAPAVGRAISEMILDGDFKTIDLTRFGFDRLIVDKPMLEACIV